MSMRKKTIRKWPVVLFALLMVSGIAIAGIAFAKMKSGGGNQNGGMEVALWDISVDSEDDASKSVTAGDESGQTYTFNVHNNSDVASNYAVTVSNIPANVNVKINGDDTLYEPVNQTVTIGNAGVLNAGDSVERTITFIATLDATKSANNSISINVTFTQKELQDEQNP